jgi:hypothetical protein
MSVDLDELQRLLDAATPRPWKMAYHHHEWLDLSPDVSLGSDHDNWSADAAFIAAARNALPDLIADLREAVAKQGELAVLSGQNEPEMAWLYKRHGDLATRLVVDDSLPVADRLELNIIRLLLGIDEALNLQGGQRKRAEKAEAELREARLERDGLQAKVDDFPCCGKCDYAKAEAERDALTKELREARTLLEESLTALPGENACDHGEGCPSRQCEYEHDENCHVETCPYCDCTIGTANRVRAALAKPAAQGGER